MDRLTTALNERHWATMYAMLTPQVRSQVDEKAYTRMFDRLFVSITEDGYGVPRSAHMSDVLMTAVGAQAGYLQRVRVQLRRSAGRVYIHHGVIELILVRGIWYIGATDDWTH